MELASYPCLTIREAVHYYDIPAKQIKRDIKLGKIPAVRIMTAKGKRWRIFPTGIPEHIKEAVAAQDKARAEIADLTAQITMLEGKIRDMTVEQPSFWTRVNNHISRLFQPLKSGQMQAEA